MNRFFVAACVAAVLSLSSLFASSAVAGHVHKTVVVRPNGNVVKKTVHVPGPHHHVRPAVVVRPNAVILRTPAIGIRIGR